MKTLILTLSFAWLILFGHEIHAQDTLRIGHLNTEAILQSMPENDSARTMLNKDRAELENMLQQMETEYQRILTDYRDNLTSYSELIRNNKESEILDMQDKIQSFQQNATLQLQQRNMELFQPIYDKLQKAIDAVAFRHQFTYVLDVSQGGVVYVSGNSQNIDSLVLRELGIR